MGTGASAATAEGAEQEEKVSVSVEDIRAALAKVLKEEDVSKLQEIVDGLEDEEFQKLQDVVAPGKKRDEADIEYAKSVGLEEAITGFGRCAMKMKPTDLNKFGADYFSGELEKQKRLVLIASNADDVDKFKGCVRDRGDMGAPIVTAVWDWAATPEDFVTQIKDLSTEHGPFKTVALCCHGGKAETKEDTEGFKWKLLENCGVQIGEGGETDAGAEDILQALADAVTTRLDLLACSLAGSKAGLDWIKEWEAKIGKNVAASTDISGNPEAGGDWILETDGIDVCKVYFKQDAIQEYAGTFESDLPFRVKRRMAKHMGERIRSCF